MTMLDPKALVEARKKKGWTQKELSDATKPKIDISTISRLERGKPTNVRGNTLEQLSKALGASPESLCKTADKERDVIKLSIGPAARNALKLVADRYHINREYIVDVAPLLFFLVAEQSLHDRQQRADELQQAAETLFDLQCTNRHLPRKYPIDEDALATEKRSIQKRDLFGLAVTRNAGPLLNYADDEYDESEHNPFAAFLSKALSTVRKTHENSEPVRFHPGRCPEYAICAEEAAAIVGGDAEAVKAILRGAAALHEMPKDSPAEERAAWARAEYDREYGDFDRMIAEFLGNSTTAKCADDTPPIPASKGEVP